MIATYNIKVNGRWIHAGEEIPEEPKRIESKPAKAEPVAAPVEAKKDEEKAKPVEAKPKTTPTRRKSSK